MMSEYEISAIPVCVVPDLWLDVAPLIESAIAYSNNEIALETVLNRLLTGDLLLIIVSIGSNIIAASTAEITTFETGKKVLCMMTIGGTKIDEWVDQLSDAVDAIGVEQGCEEVYITGRAPWARKLKRLGYGHVHTVVSKKIGVS